MADVAITGLWAIAAVAWADLVEMVDDVGWTPASKKASVDQTDTYLSQTTKTLTNKTLTAPVVNSPTWIVTDDVTESTDKNYVTDAEAVVIGNTSNTNTWDQTTVSWNAWTATALETARTIWWVSFDWTANINLPWVNASWNQDTSWTAADATALETPRAINWVNFDWSADITLLERVVTTTDDATAVIDVDVTDVYELSAVANATVFTLTWTPTDWQKLIVRYLDAWAAKWLTWTWFTALWITLPTTTTQDKWWYVWFTYNLSATAWHWVATVTEA